MKDNPFENNLHALNQAQELDKLISDFIRSESPSIATLKLVIARWLSEINNFEPNAIRKFCETTIEVNTRHIAKWRSTQGKKTPSTDS